MSILTNRSGVTKRCQLQPLPVCLHAKGVFNPAGTKQELKQLYDDRQVVQFAEFYPVGHRSASLELSPQNCFSSPSISTVTPATFLEVSAEHVCHSAKLAKPCGHISVISALRQSIKILSMLLQVHKLQEMVLKP